jgi:hypothetical protein
MHVAQRLPLFNAASGVSLQGLETVTLRLARGPNLPVGIRARRREPCLQALPQVRNVTLQARLLTQQLKRS